MTPSSSSVPSPSPVSGSSFTRSLLVAAAVIGACTWVLGTLYLRSQTPPLDDHAAAIGNRP